MSDTSCPPWCEADHDRLHVQAHQGSRAAISVPGRHERAADDIGALAIHMPGLDSAVCVNSTRLGEDTSPWLPLDPRDAVALAAIIDMLAGATPAQHVELADAIRRAAAQCGTD